MEPELVLNLLAIPLGGFLGVSLAWLVLRWYPRLPPSLEPGHAPAKEKRHDPDR